uniref:BHLH domain-containing protein n=1 Tax=Mesocestoides corti TaxID=53468 RepID=A0A5K3FA00_MESCO
MLFKMPSPKRCTPTSRRDALSSSSLSPMPTCTRNRHISQASGQRRQRRLSQLARLDQTLTNLRRVVPSVTSAGSNRIDSYEGVEALLSDTIILFRTIIEDPEILETVRAGFLAKFSQPSQPAPPVPPEPQSVPQTVDNLFTLLKLKQRSKKRFVQLRN